MFAANALEKTMLRITLLDGLEQVTLKREGSLVGVWVKETEAARRPAKAATAGRSLVVDSRAVNRVDQTGVYLLALLRQRGLRLVASGTAMAEIVRTIEKEWPWNEGETINGKGN